MIIFERQVILGILEPTTRVAPKIGIVNNTDTTINTACDCVGPSR